MPTNATTVAHVLVEQLRRLGVEHVFGLPGSTEGPLLDALDAVDSPQYILGLHENVVAAMADGYARASGRLGVVSLHTSVGTGNAVSQVLNAWVDRSPVLALIGHKDSRLYTRDGFCTVEDLPGMLRPFAKWSREVVDPAQAGEDLARAARVALTVPRGPAALVVTEDRARVPVDRAAAPAHPPATSGWSGSRPAREPLAEVARALAGADRPLLIAGDGVAWSDAQELLGRVARAYGCAIVQEPRRSAARMNCWTDDPSFCGEYDPEHPAVRDADVILAVGARVFVEFEPPPAPELPAGALFAHIHDDPSELGKRYVPDIGVVAGSREALQDLLEVAPGGPEIPEAPPARVRALREQHLRERPVVPDGGDDQPLSVAAACALLDAELPDDMILIDEGVRSSRVLLRHLSVTGRRAYHRNTGGAIGWGLPAAIGAQMACPDRPVVLFVGDGSALLTIQALWTAARYQVPVLVLVANNRGYQAVQAAVDKHRSATPAGAAVGAVIDEPAPDFVQLAAGFGVPALAVHTPGELRAALSKLPDGRPDGPLLVELVLSGGELVGAG